MTLISRSQSEILQRLKEAQRRDALGFESNEYLMGMTFETAQPFLKDEATREEWEGGDDPYPQSVEAIDEGAKEYMSFWLEKIEGQRGISVSRATKHFIAWKWLLGHPDADTFPGSFGGPNGGYYQRDAYNYVKKQMDDGTWDRMTREANPSTDAPRNVEEEGEAG